MEICQCCLSWPCDQTAGESEELVTLPWFSSAERAGEESSVELLSAEVYSETLLKWTNIADRNKCVAWTGHGVLIPVLALRRGKTHCRWRRKLGIA